MSQSLEINPAEAQIHQLLGDQYGIAGEVQRLPGENLNYLVTTSIGDRYVLKIASTDRTQDVIDMEHRAVEHILESGISLCVPRTLMTQDKSLAAVLRLDADVFLRAQLLQWVSGVPWCELDQHDDQLLSDLGRKLAGLDLALANFEHAAMYRTHRWDLSRLCQHRAKVDLITDPEHRRMLDWMFHLWTALVKPQLGSLPKSFIHNDANDENLLVERNEVTGLLDFGDSLYNPVVCSLAITLAYIMLDHDEPLGAAAKVVASYNGVRPLIESELRTLFPLICGRLATTVSVAAERRGIDPGHPNWFVTEGRAWNLIERLFKQDPGEVDAVFLLATTPIAHRNAGPPPDELLKQRRRYIGPSLSVAYKQPLKVVRGRGQFLFDHRGRPYLDLVNNICHVGHCHPRVVEAGQRQMATLNTNTRYLYDGLTDYARRLCSTLPAPLDTCFFVNSGSEANELAMRLARTHTGREDFLIVDGAYHGNTGGLINISPYKFMGEGGTRKVVPWVHLVPMADGYRGSHKGQGGESGRFYGDEVAQVIRRSGRPMAAFITETIWSCGGQVVPPRDYLRTAFAHVRQAGGLCIVDEVQVGFGRVGKQFWGFELQDVVPDIVVMGKPMGNGHPMAAVVTTREIAASFDNGMEFFSSFGGNPVSCAIGMAVLDVIEGESLQSHALRLGEHFQTGLRKLAESYEIIGDVRGEGLFLGAELVSDRDTLNPATDEASTIVNAMKERGILMSTDGPFDNVLKIKPPMTITEPDVDMVLRSLAAVLDSTAGRTVGPTTAGRTVGPT